MVNNSNMLHMHIYFIAAWQLHLVHRNCKEMGKLRHLVLNSGVTSSHGLLATGGCSPVKGMLSTTHCSKEFLWLQGSSLSAWLHMRSSDFKRKFPERRTGPRARPKQCFTVDKGKVVFSCRIRTSGQTPMLLAHSFDSCLTSLIFFFSFAPDGHSHCPTRLLTNEYCAVSNKPLLG